MTNWTDANNNLTGNLLYRPNYGPDDESPASFVWRAFWPPDDNTYTWMYYLTTREDVIGFVQDDPFGDNFLDTTDIDTRYYVTNGWPSDISYVVDGQQLQALGTVLTHDNVTGGKHEDWIFPGPGNDRVNGNPGADFIAGGSGDDLILGDVHGDILYGDGFDAPIVKAESFEDQPFKWFLPTEVDPNVVDGNDQMLGGPRGQGWTDVLTGGGGADAFYLSYTDTDSSSDGTGFWSVFANQYAGDIGQNAAKAGVDMLAAAAAGEFFESLAGSMLLGGLDTAVGDIARDGLNLLLHMHQSATPQATGEDVMVVTDFDPREDVLFLPLPTVDQDNPATTLTSTPTYYSESATGANGQTGWGIEFTKGTSNAIFAEVFLAQDFLDAFGITESSEFAFDFIHDVFDNSLVIDDQGVQESQNVYPFPTDPSAYADGVVPVVADTPIPFTAPSGTTTRVFGAFGGLSMVAPTTTTTGVYVAGTNQGDILNVNPASFDPATATSSGNLTSETSHVMAFDGDDIILGGNGIDLIHGGDGDDWIYGIGHEGVETVETFSGDDGNDLIYLGWTSMSAVVDGGDGTDTASFVYVNGTVTADLATASTNPLDGPNATSTNKADSLVSNYALMNVENLGGTENADKLTGDANDNVIQGNAGSDILDGGGGADTASYADNEGKVVADLAQGTAQEFDSAGSLASTDTLTGFENLIGSPFDDTLTGDGNDNTLDGGAGNDTLDGGGGTNTLSYAVNVGAVTIDIDGGITTENGAAGSGNTDVSTDTFQGFQGFVGSPFDDEFRYFSPAGRVFNGGGGIDTVYFGGTGDGVTVDLANGIATDNGSGKSDTLASIENVEGTDGPDSLTGDGNANRLRGFDGNDVLIGGAGDDKIITNDGMNKVTPGAGADTVDLTQSATEQADYQSNSVAGTAAEWNGDVIEHMGYTDFLTVQGWSEMATLTNTGSTVVEVELESTSTFEISVPVFSTSDLVQQLSGGNLVLSYKAASLDSDAVAAHFTSPTPITDGGAATAEDDLIVGSGHPDRLSGQAGDDIIHGLAGADALTGDGGDDVLFGGDGNDWLYGGNGNDILVSGAGIADVASGGSGADTHVFGDELANGISETDIIQDYDPLEDLIDLGGSELVAHVESASSVVLWAGADLDVIIVNGATSLDSIGFTKGALNQEVVA